MQIQGPTAVATHYGETKTSPTQRQIPQAPANSADKVTISEAGKAQAATEGPAASFDPSNRWGWLSKAAHSGSEADADKLASDMSYASDGVLVSIKDFPTIRLSSSGQIVTEKDMAYFDGMSESVKQGRINLYETEKAKGTPAAEIMDKILAYMDSLPMKYQILAGVKTGAF